MKIGTIRQRAFTLVEIMTVVVIVGLLSTLAIAGIQKVKSAATHAIVMNNLRQIYQAKEMYFSQGDSNQSGVTSYTLRQTGFISNTLWSACFESSISLGYAYQGAFTPGASVWAGPATPLPGGGISVSQSIHYPTR